ncbi:hypothetical protein [Gimesia maris]|uniref:hypothetical protein n=1 Tax=Gimesia maris TaxID=122 RepID=UPI00241FB00A|nr:hypothetical protein [Gimesia maris]|tara:strand:+ start:164986 stop:165351 length:366 start_codon:yes stop_codon:yes gene_type:complete
MNDIALIESNETSQSSENFGRHSFPKVVFFYLILLLLVFSHCLSYSLLDWDDEMHLTQNPYLNPDSPGNLGTTLKNRDNIFKRLPACYNLSESLQQLQQTTAALSALNTALKLVPARSEPA